jgi:ribosomal-protein-alanine N-acetyltransferase
MSTTTTAEQSAHRCTLEIREAVAGDLPVIASLEAEIYTLEGPWPLEDFEHDFARDNRQYLVATCRGNIVGYAAAGLDDELDAAEILMITVHPDHRRRGIAKEFMDEMIAWCTERDAGELILQVRADNAGPIALYESYGFTAGPTLVDYYSEGVHALEMHREL